MKADNQMAPHIRKTVEEIDGDIAQLLGDAKELQGTRDTLVRLYAGESDVPPVVVQTARPKPVRAARAPRSASTAPVAPAAGSGKQGRQPTAETVQLMAAARTCPEPFTAASLAVASGLESALCGKRLNKWVVAGYLSRAGRGEYKRTATFPQEAPAE